MSAQIITFPRRPARAPDLAPAEPPRISPPAPRPLGQRIEEAVLAAIAIAVACVYFGMHLFSLYHWLFSNS